MTALTCPKCADEMRTYERNGVTVDQCGGCRGIFLDRGELERLMDAEAGFYEKQAAAAPQVQPQPAPIAAPPPQQQPGYQERPYPDRRYDERKYDTDEQKYYGGGYKKKKKHSFLSELFD